MLRRKFEVLVVDDEEIFRDVIAEMLDREGFLPLKVSSGPSAIKAFKDNFPDAILLDLNMPEMDGRHTMHEIKKIDPDVPVIVVTANRDIESAVDMVKHGAFDFLTKPPDFGRLFNVLNKAIEDTTARQGILTSKQKQILQFASQGKSSQDIADLLQVKEETIKFHIEKAMIKLKATSRTQAVALAVDKKLINPNLP